MTATSKGNLYLLGAILLLAGGFGGGMCYEKAKSAEVVNGLHEHELANTLMALRYLDRKEVDEATRLLQASTSGRLAWLMESASEPREGDSVCATLNTLKAYREKHRLFHGDQWAEYRALPGIEEQEKRRADFLEQLRCGTRILYKLD